MKRTFATLTILVAGILTVSLPNGALAELTFGEWAAAKGYMPPGPGPAGALWTCHGADGVTSLDGVTSYRNLWRLVLVYNEIASLNAYQFQGLTNLKSLVFYRTKISSLHANAFQGLPSLRAITVRDDAIGSLAANQFQGLTDLETLEFVGDQLSSLAADQFQGLTNLRSLDFGTNSISSLAPNQFQGLTKLQQLRLNDNKISSLDLTGFEPTALTHFQINSNPITEVILVDATLSQMTLDTLMTGNESLTDHVGIGERAGIASVDFTAADMVGVDQFDTMFPMADLGTLILTDVLFSDAIVADGYGEVWDLISALDSQRLDALTVDQQLYVAMQTRLDTWDAGPNNVLTVVPEPSTLALLTIAGLGLLLWRRRG